MKVICKNCGAEIDQYDAVEFNTGRVQYMCMECYKAACHDIGLHNHWKALRKEKENNAKDR